MRYSVAVDTMKINKNILNSKGLYLWSIIPRPETDVVPPKIIIYRDNKILRK